MSPLDARPMWRAARMCKDNMLRRSSMPRDVSHELIADGRCLEIRDQVQSVFRRRPDVFLAAV